MSNNSDKRSSPIPIRGAARHRSASVSSSDSSPTSPSSELQTPSNGPHGPRVTIPSPGSSPILSYFLAQSPTKAPGNATFPLRGKFGPAPVFEEEEEEPHVARHARRASTTMADRFNTATSNPTGMSENGRGSGLLRRLSMSAAPQGLTKITAPRSDSPPMAPPNSAVNSPAKSLPHSATKPHRSATLSADSKPPRAPSPMGERMLKGHFDGFI